MCDAYNRSGVHGQMCTVHGAVGDHYFLFYYNFYATTIIVQSKIGGRR